MFGERHPNVGFFVGNVGWMSGFSEEPDIGFIHRINGLQNKCRECRVLLGVETPGKNKNFGGDIGISLYLTDPMGLE
jgi:hypothetical protein